MSKKKIGFAICGSFCTFSTILSQLEVLCAAYDIFPIFSQATAETDTRFGTAHAFLESVCTITGNAPILSIPEAEPIGPQALLDAIVIAPCTGNTLAKLAIGVTDSPLTMAAKAHLRNARPVIIGISTNDGLLANAPNIGTLLGRKHVYFVPFTQDDPLGKPYSLVCDFSKIGPTIEAALKEKQIQPLLL